MTETRTCRACHSLPVTDTFVCRDCIDQLHGDLHGAVDLARQLGIEASKLARHGAGPATHTPTTERPLPVNLTAADALHGLRHALVTACLDLALGDRSILPPDTIGGMAAWLITHEQAVALRHTGGDTCRDIRAATRRGREVIDNPPEKRYIGNCGCIEGEDRGEPTGCPDCGEHHAGRHPRMYARMNRPIYECRNCGAQWDVTRSLDQLEQELSDYGLTRDEIGTLMASIPRSTVNSWISRGSLPRLGTTAEGEPTYRYGDILDLDARRRERGRRAG